MLLACPEQVRRTNGCLAKNTITVGCNPIIYVDTASVFTLFAYCDIGQAVKHHPDDVSNYLHRIHTLSLPAQHGYQTQDLEALP